MSSVSNSQNAICKWPLVTVDPVLIELANSLSIENPALKSLYALREECFNKVYEICKSKKWTDIKERKGTIEKLVNSSGLSIIAKSILDNDFDLFKYLLSNNFSAQTKGKNGSLPIHYAAHIGNLNIVKYLVNSMDHCNSFSEKNNLNQTPLHIAAFKGHKNLIAYLLEEEEDIRCCHAAKWKLGDLWIYVTPLTLSVMYGHSECVDLFLNIRHAFETATIKDIGNILHVAVYFQPHNTNVLEVILNKYWDKSQFTREVRNEQGLTPLLLAASIGNIKALHYLLDKGCDINASDIEGNTALHHAVKQKHHQIISILIQKGINQAIENTYNQTALKLAESLIEKFPEFTSIAKALKNLSISTRENSLPDFKVYPPENIVFKGGGPKGIAYVGIIEELEDKDLKDNLKRIAGTSAGAIFAALLSLDYSGKEIKKILDELNLMELLDSPLMDKISNFQIDLATLNNLLNEIHLVFKNPLEVAVKIFIKSLKTLYFVNKIIKESAEALWDKKGFCTGDKFRDKMEGFIFEKTGTKNCTFGELRELINKTDKKFKHLHIFVTKLGPNSEILHINSEDSKWDHFIISDAITGSMTIPGVFQSRHLYFKTGDNRNPITSYEVVDGGLLNNLPIETFDKKKYVIRDYQENEADFPIFNRRTLGISLYDPQQKIPQTDKKVKNLKDFLSNIVYIYSEAESMIRNLNPFNQSRIIDIDNCGVTLLNFNLDDETKNKLIQSARDSFKTFWGDTVPDIREENEEHLKPANHPSPVEPKIKPFITGQTKRVEGLAGLYIFAKCKDTCNTGCGIHYPTKKTETVSIREISVKLKCESCNALFQKIIKIGFFKCSAKIQLKVKDGEVITRKFSNVKNTISLVEPKVPLDYFTIEIKKKDA